MCALMEKLEKVQYFVCSSTTTFTLSYVLPPKQVNPLFILLDCARAPQSRVTGSIRKIVLMLSLHSWTNFDDDLTVERNFKTALLISVQIKMSSFVKQDGIHFSLKNFT